MRTHLRPFLGFLGRHQGLAEQQGWHCLGPCPLQDVLSCCRAARDPLSRDGQGQAGLGSVQRHILTSPALPAGLGGGEGKEKQFQCSQGAFEPFQPQNRVQTCSILSLEMLVYLFV